MDTMSASEANLRFPCAPRPMPRPAHAAAMVAALYVMSVLCAPWIVRYAPGTEARVVEALAERPPVVRCAAAPEFGMPCGVSVPEARAWGPSGTASVHRWWRQLHGGRQALDENTLDAAGVGAIDVLRHPVGAQQIARDLHHDVIGLRAGIIVEARESLQARRT